MLVLALLGATLCALNPAREAHGYRLLYKEQLYQLYHRHLYNYPHRILENIYYLERVQQADFANPLYAIVPIENEEEWRRYRNLFNMHIALLLVEQYLQLSSRYTKYHARFFNYPWREQNIEYLQKARAFLAPARHYWGEAQAFSASAWEQRAVQGAGTSDWENRNYRIEQGLLYYLAISARHEARIENNIVIFVAMDEGTY